LEHSKSTFIELPFEYEAVLNNIETIINEFEANPKLDSKEDILKILMAEDLKLIRSSIMKHRFMIEEDENFHHSLSLCRDQSVNLLEEIGVIIDKPDIFIVDKFPPPYDRATFAAITPDAFDEKHYGIQRGIYFRNSSLCPIYSRFLLVHEIIHSFLGEISPQYMGRGLEEGLAEIVGAIYLGNNILGKEITKSTFYHNRLGFGIDQFWQLYLDYARMAAYLYNRFGMDGLVGMLMSGRCKIKEVEKLCFQGRYEEIELQSGNWINDVTDVVNFVTLTFSRDFVVSPTAFYTAKYTNEGDDVEKIAKAARLNPGLVLEALRELQDRVFVLLYSGDHVDISDTKMLMEAKAIRYEIK